MRQALAADGLPVVEFHMRTANLSEPTKELGAAMQAGRIRHDGNPVLEWFIGNVVGHLDARGNVYPAQSPSGAEDRCCRGAHHGAGSSHQRRGPQRQHGRLSDRPAIPMRVGATPHEMLGPALRPHRRR